MKKNESATNQNSTGKPKPNWMLLALIVLLCVSAFCGYGAARMRSDSEEADSARVAAYAASASLLSVGDINIDCNADDGNTAQYQFQVRNTQGNKTSEVDMKYDIEVTLDKALPEGITAEVDGTGGTVSTDRKTITFSNAGWSFEAAAAASKNHTLTFTADSDKVTSDTEDIQVSILVLTRQTD